MKTIHGDAEVSKFLAYLRWGFSGVWVCVGLGDDCTVVLLYFCSVLY